MSSERSGIIRQLSESPTAIDDRQFTTIPATDGIINSITTNNVQHEVRCKFCYSTQPEDVSIAPDAKHECVVLSNEILANIYMDKLDVIQHNLTNYCIYDENGHMCSIDSGIMERNVALYMTGYVKPIYDNSPGVEGGFAAYELGPILEWWLSSYDGGSQVIIGISTDFADYLLIEPHSSYQKYMISVTEKIQLSRIVIENILISKYDDPTYEDILNCIVNSVNPATGNKFTEEDLITHAQFVLNQVIEYDANDTHHLPLAETQCLETLTELSGAEKATKVSTRRSGRTGGVKSDIAKREFSKATITELVKDVFENMFAPQLDNEDKEIEATINKLENLFDEVCSTNIKSELSELITVNKNHVMWKDQKLCEKMFIYVKINASSSKLIGRIEYFLKNKDKVHIILFLPGFQTVLGETSDPQEIFATKKCMDIDVSNIVSFVEVKQKIPSNNWFNLGNSKLQDLLEPVDRNNKKSLFYQQQYDDELGRFEYPRSEFNLKIDNYCYNCDAENLEKISRLPIVSGLILNSNDISYFYKFELKNKEYKVGNFVYLKPDVFSTASRSNFVGQNPFIHIETNKNKSLQVLKKVDETMYPEYYRKTLENTMCGSNETTPNPFEIGEILAIYVPDWDKKIKILVRRMYRAEQILLNDFDKNADMNMLFWSEEEFRVSWEDIVGKCFVVHISNISNPLTWSAEGPDRFYFTEQYNFLTGTIIPECNLPVHALSTGTEVKVNYNYELVEDIYKQFIPSYKKIKPLRGLDLFAGCGGLSKGLEDSGLLKTHWAIECDDKAAAAFQLNNPKSTVFVEDCNHLLKSAMSGCTTNDKNQKIPQKGEVDFICGGPPCQGFSGLNRFNSGQYSLFKNSLIVSFLAYIDFYRPRFFVMENVRNFVTFKRSMVLKLTLRCITRMGYQCTFGILQAGHFGVPQTRRRLIIMAAAPGEQLPLYPEPKHVFNKKCSSLIVQVGDKKFKTNCEYEDSAPMRTVTVYDAWSDLPAILNGADQEEIAYQSQPITHLQRLLRYPNNCLADSLLTDHICKDMSPLVQARIELIPVGEGSDWRDLPNIVVQLSDGTKTNKLIYSHNDIKNGKGQGGMLRGVCQCASGRKCNPQDRQTNTIVPWCLPHTGNRHNNWAGLYGRLAWTGFCSTTITNPEPMGKQGRVLHPEQNRVVSVRECARSQGFNDSYIFYGPIINKHRQIGNAVPPPMGRAIGHEIIKVIKKKHVLFQL